MVTGGKPILFQSTHPRGVRPNCKYNFVLLTPVSIHAPARGATAPLPSPLNRAFERQNARTSAFWAFFHAVFLKQTVFSLFFSQLPLRGSHWETSVSLRFPFFRFCSFLLSRGAVFQTSGLSIRWRFWRRHVPAGFSSWRPENRTAGCLFPRPYSRSGAARRAVHWAGSTRHSRTQYWTRCPQFWQSFAILRKRFCPCRSSVLTS